MFELTDKVALVTGSTSGIGKSDAITLAKQGAKVVVTGRNLEECEEVVEEIKANGGKAVAMEMDVLDLKEIDRTITETVNKYGHLDILVNNAGIYASQMAIDMTEDQWDKMIDINLKGQFFCAQRAAKEMSKNKWGRIINIASVASGQVGIGFMGGSHYTASKGGIIGMTETLAIEWAEHGININVVAPGAIDTPMLDDAGMDEQALKGLLTRVPLKRVGKPEEVSAMVAFLASEEASYITGATFHVDGGWLAT